MSRPKNMSEVIKLQTRWKRLGAFISNVLKEMHRPLPNSQRKSTVIICGRIINKLVCNFAVSDSVTTRTLHDLNTMLMRVDNTSDITEIQALEIEILNSLAFEVTAIVDKLASDIAASKPANAI